MKTVYLINAVICISRKIVKKIDESIVGLIFGEK